MKTKVEEPLTQQSTQLRLDEKIQKAKKVDKITYEEFEELADIIKEFLVRSGLLNSPEISIFLSHEAIKKDKEGYFKIISFINNVPPETLNAVPVQEFHDYLIITQRFLKEVKVLDFFTLNNMILTNLISV